MRMIAMTLAALVAFAAQADDLAQIKQAGVIKVGIKDNSPPFSQIDPATSRVVGFDIDMALAIARQLGVKPDLRTLQSDRRLPLLKDRSVDIVVADLAKTEEREKEIDFSVGYFVAEERVYGKVGRFKSMEDVNMATLAVNSGTSLEADFKKEHPSTKLILVADKPDLAKQLNAGLVDGIASSMPILIDLQPKIQNKKLFEYSPFPLSVKIYAVGIRKGQKGLRQAIDGALMAMENSGEAAKIYERWFGPNTPTPILRSFKIGG